MKRNVFATFVLIVAVQLMAMSAYAGEANIEMKIDASVLQKGQEATIKVFINTSEPIGAYQFDIAYDPSILEIIDIQPGTDGFVTASARDNGLIKVNGFDVNGKGPGELEFLLIKIKAKARGNASISVSPVILANADGQKIQVSVNGLSPSID